MLGENFKLKIDLEIFYVIAIPVFYYLTLISTRYYLLSEK